MISKNKVICKTQVNINSPEKLATYEHVIIV